MRRGEKKKSLKAVESINLKRGNSRKKKSK